MTAASGTGGRFDFDDGGSYAGDWSDGMAHGYGVCTGPKGEGEYSGAWLLGFETSGVFRAGGSKETGSNAMMSGPVYEGQWLQGRRHGLGVDSRGTPGAPPGGPRWLYRGEWTQGFRGRYGVRQSTATGTKYEGTWTAGLQDGYGVETYADGGTYQGQWLRGVRHGYGIRQSVSYEVAVRYPTHTAVTAVSIPVPGSMPTEKEDDVLLRERDFRIEESRGGFVLRARTYPLEHDTASGKHRMILDKNGRPSLRKTIVKELRMIRQRSTGDLNEASSRSSSRMSGSVRSTSSHGSYTGSVGTTTTGQGSVYSDEGSEASFVSQTDIPLDSIGQGQELIERYLGEWKGDRRSGYGIAERTDGLRYEGEWANNRKHGYGVTILRDGARIEGKYKNNILVASVSGGKTSSKLFTLRSGKLRDRVDAATKAASRAADIARQKAEIANARMLSARMKAEQAEEVAKRAAADAEMARNKAREYSPNASQPGSSIIANRPTQETELQAEVNTYTNDAYDNPTQMQTTSTSPTKLFTFFKSKKTTPQQPQQYVDGIGIGAGAGGTLQSYSQTSTLTKGNAPFSQNAATLGNGHGGPMTNGRYPPPDGYGRTGSNPVPRITTTAAGGGGSEVFETTQQAVFQQAAYSSNIPASTRGFYGGSESTSVNPDGTGAAFGHTRGHGQTDAYPVHQQSNVTGYGDSSMRTGGTVLADSPGTWSSFSAGSADGTVTSSTTYAHGGGGYPQHQVTLTAESRRAAMMHSGGQRSFDDKLPALSDRRNSLPSIVKSRAEVPAATTGAGAMRSRATASGNTSAAAASGGKMDVTAKVARQRPQVDTYVIENGVRMRVRSIYDESPVRNTTSVSKSSTAAAKTVSPLEAIKTRRKMYTLESPRRPDMGSVPDVSAVSKDEVLPREVVSVLSQRRREELIRQRENDERRQRNQIVFQLGDMMDWCERRRMLVFLIAINISLASVFYTMLSK